MEQKYRIWTRKGIMSDWVPSEAIGFLRGASVVFYESLLVKPLVDRDLEAIQASETGRTFIGGVLGYDKEKQGFFLYANDTVTPLPEYLVRQLLQREQHECIRAYVTTGKGSIADYLKEQV